LVSYELLSLFPFEVRECSKATEGACGTIYLNARYEALIRRKLDPHADKLLTPKRLDANLRFFDAVLKPGFNNHSKEMEEFGFQIPLPGAPDIPSIGLKDERMMITKYTLSSTELTE
jgi:hypothetical protein